MKVLKNIFSQLHTFILWAMLCALLWGWIYTFVGDTSQEKKVVIFIDAVAIEDHSLALRLEENKPAGIKMIKVHDFSFDMFGTNSKGDIYIVPESELIQLLEEREGVVQSFPAPEGMPVFERGGKCYGIRIFDAETQTGAGDSAYIRYIPADQSAAENYYLCFGTETVHLDCAKNGVDNAAWEVAMELLKVD